MKQAVLVWILSIGLACGLFAGAKVGVKKFMAYQAHTLAAHPLSPNMIPKHHAEKPAPAEEPAHAEEHHADTHETTHEEHQEAAAPKHEEPKADAHATEHKKEEHHPAVAAAHHEEKHEAKHEDEHHDAKHEAAHEDKHAAKHEEKHEAKHEEKHDDKHGDAHRDDHKKDAAHGDEHHGATNHDAHTKPTAEWTYTGKTGPAAWANLNPDYKECGSGMYQSPINLTGSKSAEIASPIEFRYHDSQIELKHDGKAINVDVASENTIVTQGRVYRLRDVVFHTPSEHTLRGERFPMEITLVHEDEKGSLLNLAVFVKAGKKNSIYSNLIAKLPKSGKSSGPLKFNPLHFVPEDKTYLRYDGSLTTPPCSEGVVWNVLRSPIKISEDQVIAFSKLTGKNARPVQPSHTRVSILNDSGANAH